MADNAIEVCDIRKSFKVYYDKGNTLKEKVLYKSRNKYEVREVLKGISFHVKKGEAVGLIGHNGCGKSTTLKLLARIMYPDSGSIQMQGRVSSLLELGAGFHPDMSGRENVYINASIFGLNKKEIDKRIGSIIEFSELEEFIDLPVRTYSSGMYMRLAFAVAIHVNADILLLDEILAVGDVNFQEKCLRRLMEIKKSGATIILVSHAASQIEKICDRSIWIHDGKIKEDGNVSLINRKYLMYMSKGRAEGAKAFTSDLSINRNKRCNVAPDNHKGTGEAEILSVWSLNSENEMADVFSPDDAIVFEMEYQVKQTVKAAFFGVAIMREDGVCCYGTDMEADGIEARHLEKDGCVEYTLEKNQLLEGRYSLDVCIIDTEGELIDICKGVCSFQIYNRNADTGICRIPHIWTFQRK